MTDNYNIIIAEYELRRFIEWLPDLLPHEKFYVCLFARSKYTKDLEDPLVHIKSDKAQLKRFTATKADLYWKLKQLECPLGSYRQKDIAVPQEALAVYMTINPRDCYRAQFSSLTALSRCIQNQNKGANPHQEVMSEIQRTKSRTCRVVFDVDEKSGYRLTDFLMFRDYLEDYINPEALNIIETRGGYHILVNPELVEPKYRKIWYKRLQGLSCVDQVGDIMTPIPGTYQGGFSPVLYPPQPSKITLL